MNNKIKTLAAATLVGAALLTGCSDASVVSQNLSTDSDNFKIARRVVFVNGITDGYFLSVEGFCSIEEDNASGRGQLEVTCKDGEGAYRKHFLGLSDNATYFVEQLDSANVSPSHYKVVFKPSTIVPEAEIR